MAVIRDAHFPGRAQIDAYGNGGFRFAGMSHRGSLLLLPSGIYGWEAIEPADITAESLARVIAEAAGVEVLLVGMGAVPFPLAAGLKSTLRGHTIMTEAMTTGAAVRTFNVLLGESRAVAAALLAVD